MSSRNLTCACGHSWIHAAPGPIPADLTQICPLCASRGGDTPPPLPGAADAGKVRQRPAPDPHADTYAWSGAAEDGSGGQDTVFLGIKPGTILGVFEVMEEINRGGMGVIYKARQQGLNRLVALKVITPDQLRHADALKRFQREVQAAALLSHPNIVTVFHTDLSGPWPYLAMEFVAGIDLYRLVRQAGILSILDACFYVEQVAQGLQHAHECGLVHRDIKPANLMVTPSPLDRPTGSGAHRRPRVKILDLGLARVTLPDQGGAVNNLTRMGEYLGTPDFMSPEQADDPRLVDTRSDLYSLGGTLYFLLTGEAPFPGRNLVLKQRRQRTQPPPSLRDKRPDAPESVVRILERLLARDPAGRYQTPIELAEALTAVLREPERPSVTPHAPSPAVRTSVSIDLPPEPAPSTHNTTARVHAHDGGVRSLCLSPDGSRLLSGGADQTLRMWDTTKLREQFAIADNVGPVGCVRMAPGGKWVATCAAPQWSPADRVVQLWYLASRSERRRLKGHTRDLRCVAVSPDGRRVAAGGDDPDLRLWLLEDPGAPPLVLKGHTDAVRSVAFLSAALLVSAGQDGSVRLWDVHGGAPKGALNARVGPVSDVALGGATKRLAFAGANGLRLRQADGSLLALNGHDGAVLCAAFSPDGRLLVSGGLDHSVRLWRAEDGAHLAALDGHTDAVHALAFSPDGESAFSGGADGTLRRWPVST